MAAKANRLPAPAAGVLLLCMVAPAGADQAIAHSKSLQMAFTALGDPWCLPQVQMQVTAEDPGKFGSEDFRTIVQKLGHVLATECPAAEHIAISGLDKTGAVHWRGTASQPDGWLAQPEPAALPLAAAVPDPIPSAPAEPEVPASSADVTAAAPGAPSDDAAAPSAPPTAVSTQPPAAAPATAAPSPALAAPAPVETGTAVPPEPGTAGSSRPETPAPPAATPTPAALQIAGWQPGGAVLTGPDVRPMTEIPAQDSGCLIRTLLETKPELNASYQANRPLVCDNDYANAAKPGQRVQASLYYLGQKQPFGSLGGTWFDGYNLDKGQPRQVVARYKTVQRDNYRRRTIETDKLLVWTGEDRALRAHFFAGYSYSSHYNYWQLDAQAPYIVLTDNVELHQQPAQTGLAEALAAMHRDFLGYKSTDQFSAVNFVIVDQLHNAPGHKQLELSLADLDPSLHQQGQAVRQRGLPWSLKITGDFAALRAAQAEAERRRTEAEARRLEAERQRQEELRLAQVEAERQRAEAERQRLEALRARHQAAVDNQHKLLAQASRYDQLRFYATLKLLPDRLQPAKVDLSSTRVQGGNPLQGAVTFAHPAKYFDRAKDGEVALAAPLHLLVHADDGRIDKPYPMTVDYNESRAELDGWMLVQLAGKFRVGFDQQGRPSFEVTVQEAVPCSSERCLGELDAAAMMRAWYGDPDLQLALIDQPEARP